MNTFTFKSTKNGGTYEATQKTVTGDDLMNIVVETDDQGRKTVDGQALSFVSVQRCTGNPQEWLKSLMDGTAPSEYAVKLTTFKRID